MDVYLLMVVLSCNDSSTPCYPHPTKTSLATLAAITKTEVTRRDAVSITICDGITDDVSIRISFCSVNGLSRLAMVIVFRITLVEHSISIYGTSRNRARLLTASPTVTTIFHVAVSSSCARL